MKESKYQQVTIITELSHALIMRMSRRNSFIKWVKHFEEK